MSARNLVRVLLLEPDAAAATLMIEAMSLRATDFQIVRSMTLGDALQLLATQPCEVALVELNLDDAEGLYTLVRLRQANPSLPIVVLTTIADEDMAITAIQQGAQDYLIKESVHYSLVSRSIRYAIERKRIEGELQAAKESALAASSAKSAFLARMSHEIRNPLTAIVNYAEILLEPDFDAGERRAALETIRRNGLHLLEVVNDVLDISKIESRAFDVERVECSPREVVSEVVEMFHVRAKAKGLNLAVDWRPEVPDRILSDPLRFKQILVNLISNAVKFTEHGEVRILAELLPASPIREPTLQVAVADTGIGISPAQRQRLFQAYQQTESSIARQFGGTGLGLAISRELARKLGGDISVESTPGVGSTFIVRIAARPVKNKAASAAAGTGSGESRQKSDLHGKLLLADDGPDNRRLISTLLRKAGATVDIVENGQQAVERALESLQSGQPYDVILMDMVMPEKDGFAATRELREAGYTRPIVALTANSGSGARQECLSAGCDAFASKPIDRETLIAVVRQWLPKQEQTPAK
jgi:signal transduction histidine kinase